MLDCRVVRKGFAVTLQSAYGKHKQKDRENLEVPKQDGLR